MNIKQKIQNGEKSFSLQAGHDINYGLSYDEVKQIFYDLFDKNFPKLVGKAKEEIDSRINLLWQQLLKDLQKNQNEIELNNFSNPNIQYELSQISKDSARFGNIDNYSILSKIFISQLKKDSQSVNEQIISECLDIVPKLSKKQLYILIIHKIYDCCINTKYNLQEFDKKLFDYNEYISYLLKSKDNYNVSLDLFYLKLVNCLNDAPPTLETIYYILKKELKINTLENNKELYELLEEKKLYNIIKLIELTKKYTLISHKLTRIGETLVTYILY